MGDMSILTDCGFCGERAGQYRKAVEAADYAKQLVLLKEQRTDMLSEMRSAAGKVDCIDFLICKCKNKMKEEEEQ